MKKIISFWALGIIILAWIVLSSPYLLKHLVPYPATFQVSFFSPWNNYKEYQIPTKNGALSDVVDQIFPWKHFTIEMLKKGQIPLWNPYSFAGNPHLADSQTAVLSPFNLLFFIFPFIDAWSLLILSQPLIAGLGMYIFLRELKISKEGSVMGSIAFMFCGFIVVWMPYGTLAMAIAFLPLALYATEKNFQKIHIPSLSLLPLSIAISFFSGHIQTSVYMLLYLLAYILFKYFTTKNRNAFLVTSSLLILGLVISLLQLIPTLQLYQQAGRSQDFSNAGGIPWQYLMTTFAPDFFGNPVTRNDWFGKYAEWSSFIGLIPLTLAITAIFQKKDKIKTLYFLLAGVAALVLAMDTPIQSFILFLKLPIFSTSIPSRIIVLFSFSFAVLSAFGLDILKSNLQKKSYNKIIPIFVGVGTLLFVIWINLLGIKFFPKDKIGLAEKNFILPTAIFLILSLSITILAFMRRSSALRTQSLRLKEQQSYSTKIIIKGVVIIIIILTLFDSLRFAQKWLPFDETKYVFPDLPIIKAMQQKIGQGRVYGNFGSYIDTYYNLPSIEGYDPLYNHRYGEFIQSAKTGEWTPAIHSLAILDKQAKYAARVLDLLGVTILLNRKDDTFTPWTFPVWGDKQRYFKIYTDDKFELYKNTTALPRAQVFYKYEVIQGDKNIIKRVYSDTFDYQNTLILEENPHIQQSVNTQGKAEIKTLSPNNITIQVASPRQGILFLSDNSYPSWKAYINGKETKILRADYTFNAIIVPSGKSTVEFKEKLL